MEPRRNAITPPVGHPVCKIRFLGAGMIRVRATRWLLAYRCIVKLSGDC